MASEILHPEPLADAGVREILLNGEPHRVPTGATVRDLLDELKLGVERVAVEVDRRIVRRAEWSGFELSSGAAVEVVHFVGGG